MAARTMWRGVLEVSLFQAHVSVKKATEDYRGTSPLHELCECHQKPFKRRQLCEGGRARLTTEMTTNGETENTTSMVKGVKADDDTYLVLDPTDLTAIDQAGTSDVMTVDALVDMSQVPTERGNGLYYITPDSKVKKSAQAVEVLCTVLQREKSAVITKWASRGRERVVAIYPKDGTLVMQVIMYDSEVRPPDETCLIGSEGISDPEIEIATLVLGKLAKEYDFAAAQDETIIARERVVTAARNKEPLPKREPVAGTDAAPDLMAALKAALDAAPEAHDTRRKRGASNGAVPVGASS